MKNIGVVTALLLAATLSSGAMAAENSFARPEAGSNIDTSVHQNHIDIGQRIDIQRFHFFTRPRRAT